MSFSSIAATPVISAASSAGIAAPEISLSASWSGPRPGNCARSVARSRTGTRGAFSMILSVM